MKKILFILSIVLFCASCSDDDNENGGTNELIGKWAFFDIRVHIEADKASVRQQVEKDRETDLIKARGSYIEFSEDKYTNTYEGYNKIDYSIKNGSIYHFDPKGETWDSWKYTQIKNTFTYVFDETEEYKKMFPEGGVRKVIIYWDYLKSDL